MVAVIGDDPVLVAVKVGNDPVPEAGRPMAVLLLVQVKSAFGSEEVNGIDATAPPLQNAVFETGFILGGVQMF